MASLSSTFSLLSQRRRYVSLSPPGAFFLRSSASSTYRLKMGSSSSGFRAISCFWKKDSNNDSGDGDSGDEKPKKWYQPILDGVIKMVCRTDADTDKYPYPTERIFYGLENPVYCLLLFGLVNACVPNNPKLTIYRQLAWKFAWIMFFAWLALILKTNIVTHIRSYPIKEVISDKLVAVDKVTSIALIAKGLCVSAEGYDEIVTTLLKIGGLATVLLSIISAKEMVKNVCDGLYLSFHNSFRNGDTIKTGSVEGKVVNMGLIRTTLLSKENYLVTTSNSKLMDEVIVNHTRVAYQATQKTLPLECDDLSTIDLISVEVEEMLKTSKNVWLKHDPPYCCCSNMEKCYAELTFAYNLPNMTEGELSHERQVILMQVIKIIRKNGVALGKKKK